MVYDATHGIMDSPRRPEQVRAIAGAGAFLRDARHLGYTIIVVTNQPGIAKRTLTVVELDAVNATLADQLKAAGGRWDDLYYCPHHPNPGPDGDPTLTAECDCRKPAPGMLLAAAEKHGIDLARSWMIGDGINDIQAGNAAGCRTLLVARIKPEHLIHLHDDEQAQPTAFVPDLDAALNQIRADNLDRQ